MGIIVALGRHYLGDIGGCGWGDTFYVAPLLGLAGVWLLVALILMISSGRGSPSQDRPTCIPFLLSLRLGLLIAFVGNNIMGGVWFLSEGVQEACSAFFRGDQIQHVLVFQTVLSSVAILQFFGLWCCCCSRKYPPMEPRNEALLQRTLELHVYKFMRTWCWPLVDNTGVDEHYESISRSFQELFNDVDFTFDDILLGLYLLDGRQQTLEKRRWEQHRQGNADEGMLTGDVERGLAAASTPELATIDRAPFLQDKTIPFRGDADVFILEEFKYYYRYAFGVYGSSMYLYLKPCSLRACDVWCCSDALCCFAKGNRDYAPATCLEKTCPNCANCFGVQYATARRMTHAHKEDILYISFKNSVLYSPFGVFVDREKRDIVVVIRGTYSLDDCIKDCMVEAMPTDEVGKKFGFDGTNEFCHKGVYSTAMTIVDVLLRKQLLPSHHEGDELGSYGLKIVGHSLGGAVAAVVALLMRNEVPTVRALLFSALPIFSPGLVQQTKDFVFMVTVGLDLPPRLSPQNVLTLKRQLGEVLKETKSPKCQTLCRCGCAACCCLGSACANPGSFHESLDLDIGHPKDHLVGGVKSFYLPGRIIHFTKHGTRPRRCCNPSPFHANWIENNVDSFQEIVVRGPSMMLHHFPDEIWAALDTPQH